MSQSSKILLIAGGIYLIVAVVGYRYGVDLFRDRKIYEILAYLVVYQVIVYLLLCEPLSILPFRTRVIMLLVVGLVLLGQLLNNSRKYYPFSSWRMYSTAVPSGTVIHLESMNPEGDIMELNTSMFSPARSSRPHEQLLSRIVRNRNADNDSFITLMNYYCETLHERGWDAESIHIRQVSYSTQGITKHLDPVSIHECIRP